MSRKDRSLNPEALEPSDECASQTGITGRKVSFLSNNRVKLALSKNPSYEVTTDPLPTSWSCPLLNDLLFKTKPSHPP